MKFKNLPKASLILAGGMMFAGTAGAAISFNSTFDNGVDATNDGSWTGFNTYAYGLGYTLAAPAGSGTHYGKTNAGSLTTTIDLTNAGADTATIAAGNMTFNFSAWLGSYTGNPDRAQISYEFFDSGAALIGAAVVFDDGAAGTPNGTWNEYTDSGTLATNAASVLITIANSTAAGQAGSNDGYADLVSFSTNTIPEPSSAALLGLGSLALLKRRRK